MSHIARNEQGSQGRLGIQAVVPSVEGTWKVKLKQAFATFQILIRYFGRF